MGTGKTKKVNLKLYKEYKEGLKCTLCPHFCFLKNGQTGRCLVRKSNGKEIYLFNYGYLTNIAVEPIEKKPFNKFLSGTKTLSLSSMSCNLACAFCENFEVSQNTKNIISKKYLLNEVIKLALENNCKSVCMTYTEPIIHYEYLLDLAEECHENNLKFILKTNAYINKKPWLEICKIVDAINIDWKGTEKEYKEICKVNDYVIEKRLKEASKTGIHIEISVPVYPDKDDMIYIYRMAKVITELSLLKDDDIPVHLLRIFPANKWENKLATSRELIEFAKKSFLSCSIESVFVHL